MKFESYQIIAFPKCM